MSASWFQYSAYLLPLTVTSNLTSHFCSYIFRLDFVVAVNVSDKNYLCNSTSVLRITKYEL